MAARLTVLIAALPLLGCVEGRSAHSARAGCGGCHVAHDARLAGCDDCHRGQPAAARKQLAHARLLTGRAAEHALAHGPAVQEGRRLAEAAACRRCHTIAGAGNRLATRLDEVVWSREQRELLASITEPVEAMPSFGFDRRQAEAVIAYLLSSGRGDSSEPAYRVHFTGVSSVSSAFDESCGGCHRVLTPSGPRGTGRQGPDLSGLFSSFYPPTAPGERAWSERALADWIANPRAHRPATSMLPVSLSDAQRRQVVDLIEEAR